MSDVPTDETDQPEGETPAEGADSEERPVE